MTECTHLNQVKNVKPHTHGCEECLGRMATCTPHHQRTLNPYLSHQFEPLLREKMAVLEAMHVRLGMIMRLSRNGLPEVGRSCVKSTAANTSLSFARSESTTRASGNRP
jgi:hypothetical protein